MKRDSILFILLFIFVFFSCHKSNSPIDEEPKAITELRFGVDHNYILKNGERLDIKGVVYVPGYPGFLPWEIEKSESLPFYLRNSIFQDLTNIKAMGANTIRFWGAPKYCYQALNEIGDLYFLQTIWIQGDVPDFQDIEFKNRTKAYIRQVVDRIYSVFPSSPPLIAFIVGNELSRESILSTDSAHPNLHQYLGRYISTDTNITASEAFLAEMADYTKSYEFDKYAHVSLVTYANEIRTADIIETPFLNFISHNTYSYAVAYYQPNTQAGSHTGTIFQGYLEELKSRNPQKPLLITESGLSVSPNAQHIGAPNYGYGGNTEQEQADGLLQNINDSKTTQLPMAGLCVHEYLDAWWKFGLEDSYSQDPDDIEEWFGLVRLSKENEWYLTDFRQSYYALQKVWQ